MKNDASTIIQKAEKILEVSQETVSVGIFCVCTFISGRLPVDLLAASPYVGDFVGAVFLSATGNEIAQFGNRFTNLLPALYLIILSCLTVKGV